jgi:hypothetical protein
VPVAKVISITDKIHDDLKRLAEKEGIALEGLACVLLRLALSDERLVGMALRLIKACDLNYGAAKLGEKGW